MCETLRHWDENAILTMSMEDGNTINVETLNATQAKVWFEDVQGNKLATHYVAYTTQTTNGVIEHTPIQEQVDENTYVIDMWKHSYSIVRTSDQRKLAEIRRRLPIVIVPESEN